MAACAVEEGGSTEPGGSRHGRERDRNEESGVGGLRGGYVGSAGVMPQGARGERSHAPR